MGSRLINMQNAHCSIADPSDDINDILRKAREKSQIGKKSAKVRYNYRSILLLLPPLPLTSLHETVLPIPGQ